MLLVDSSVVGEYEKENDADGDSCPNHLTTLLLIQIYDFYKAATVEFSDGLVDFKGNFPSICPRILHTENIITLCDAKHGITCSAK